MKKPAELILEELKNLSQKLEDLTKLIGSKSEPKPEHTAELKGHRIEPGEFKGHRTWRELAECPDCYAGVRKTVFEKEGIEEFEPEKHRIKIKGRTKEFRDDYWGY